MVNDGRAGVGGESTVIKFLLNVKAVLWFFFERFW